MQFLYPSINPYAIHNLAVDPIHTLYIEESGNPEGLPVIFIHGGPGAGTCPDQRRFFNPAHYRIILYDQRGAGKSTPHAELKQNTTQDLISDLEAIRNHLNIPRMVLFGGSWGSTLALLYAEAYPEHVINLVLRGIFLCRPEDIQWFYQAGGASRLFPDAWETFCNELKPHERSSVLKSYYQGLIGPDEVLRMSLAKAWSQWEGVCSTLLPNQSTVDHFTDQHLATSLARIETHYFINNTFLEPNQILKNADKIANIPGNIVHGRYDIVCPLDNAYALQKVWPLANLTIINDAGHSAFEPAICRALVNIMDEIVDHCIS